MSGTAARAPANERACGESGGGVGNGSHPIQPDTTGAENAGSVAEMCRSQLVFVQYNPVERAFAGNMPCGIPEIPRYDGETPDPCSPDDCEQVQRVFTVQADGTGNRRKVQLRTDEGVLRGQADGGETHGDTGRLPDRQRGDFRQADRKIPVRSLAAAGRTGTGKAAERRTQAAAIPTGRTCARAGTEKRIEAINKNVRKHLVNVFSHFIGKLSDYALFPQAFL